MDFKKIENEFKQNIFHNEDDIKIHFHSDIVKPILKNVNPEMYNHYRSEQTFIAGGRSDATFQNISFEFKKEAAFNLESGIDEALYGRDDKDHGLYDYIISNAGIEISDTEDSITKKITNSIGVGIKRAKINLLPSKPTPMLFVIFFVILSSVSLISIPALLII